MTRRGITLRMVRTRAASDIEHSLSRMIRIFA